MKRNPYPHQQKAIDDIECEMKNGARSVILVASPRFGKTLVSSNIINRAQQKGSSVIFCVHRENLIKQTANTFADDGIDFGYIKSGMEYDASKTVHIASIQTLLLRLPIIKPPKLMFVDECHLAKADGYDTVIQHFKAAGTRIIGLTGTPWRLDGRALGDIFDVMVKGPSVRWLIDNGYLANFRYYAPPSEVRGLFGDVIYHYKKHAAGKLAVAYCVDVKHSKQTCAALNEAGMRAAHIDGSMKKDELQSIYERLGNREIDVLCSIELVKEGFDLSAQVGKPITIECVMLLRKTKSLALFLQMAMRCMTKQYGEGEAVILDFGGNVLLHGLPDNAFDWSLEGRAISDKGGKSEGVEAPYLCESCYNAIVKPVPDVCPYCHDEIKKQSAMIKIIEGELREIKEAEAAALREKHKQQEREARTLNDFIALAIQRQYKNPSEWAKRKTQGRAMRMQRLQKTSF